MRPDAGLVLWIFALFVFGGPLVLAIVGWRWNRPAASAAPPPAQQWNWRLTVASTLLYVLAFNLVFFVQELFLVLPKALTPGLHPVLFHNNHDWTGDNPVARLLQGTGALAIVLVGLAAWIWVRRPAGRSTTLRLFLIWVAFHGLFEALPQGVVGAILPGNDVGMAMDYLRFPPPIMLACALEAMAAMAFLGAGLAGPLLGLAGAAADLDTPARRHGFLFRTATLPALIGMPLILPFRVPGSMDQVVLVPVAVTIIGILWVQAGASLAVADGPLSPRKPASILIPLATLAILLLVFQLVLRPGIAF